MNKGIWYALGAYVFWGLFPIYWRLLAGVPALQLLGHRIFWSFLLLFGIILILRQGKELRAALELACAFDIFHCGSINRHQLADLCVGGGGGIHC